MTQDVGETRMHALSPRWLPLRLQMVAALPQVAAVAALQVAADLIGALAAGIWRCESNSYDMWDRRSIACRIRHII